MTTEPRDDGPTVSTTGNDIVIHLDDLPESVRDVARHVSALTVLAIKAAHQCSHQPTQEVTSVTTTITEDDSATTTVETAALPAAVDPMAATHAVLEAHGRGHAPQGGYLSKKCFEQAAKDNMPDTYPEDLKLPYSDFVLDLMGNGNDFEDKIGQRLIDEADPTQVVVIGETKDENGDRTEAGKAQKEKETWEAYRNPNVRLIFNARMAKTFSALVSEYFGTQINDPDRVSEPDAIELGPVMDNGLRAMRFVDVKWHKTTTGTSKEPKSFRISRLDAPFFPGEFNADAERIELYGNIQSDDWMQLAHYYRHAQTLGLVDHHNSIWGAVIGKEEVLVWARLDEQHFMRYDPKIDKRRKQSPLELYDREFQVGLDVVDNAIARDIDPSVPALTFPEWKTDCKECPWKDVCLQELTTHGDGGHITLLPGITPDRARAFYDLGIDDAGSLARLPLGVPVEGIKDEPLETAIYQARVSKAQKVHRAPGVEFVDLPRADIEIDFDYEADKVVYQRGVRALGRKRQANGDYRERVEMNTFDDFTGTDEGEMRVFVEMWAYFESMIMLAKARKHSILFYHYTRYERTQDLALAKKYAGQPGVPTEAMVEDFYASDMVVDLYEVLSKQLVWPTKSHSIKDLAKYTKFSWRGSVIGGDVSMVWYRTAVNDPDPQVRAEAIAQGREYNEDDVIAQAHLREWVTSLGESRKPGDKLPSVETLRAPVPPRKR